MKRKSLVLAAAITVGQSKFVMNFKLKSICMYSLNQEISIFFYEYDPALDMWTMKATYPGLFPNRPKEIQQNGYGYFIGGMDVSWTWCTEVWRYDSTNDSWLQLQGFPRSTRRRATAVNVSERVYYGLGTNFNDFWEFNLFKSSSIFLKLFVHCGHGNKNPTSTSR